MYFYQDYFRNKLYVENYYSLKHYDERYRYFIKTLWCYRGYSLKNLLFRPRTFFPLMSGLLDYTLVFLAFSLLFAIRITNN